MLYCYLSVPKLLHEKVILFAVNAKKKRREQIIHVSTASENDVIKINVLTFAMKPLALRFKQFIKLFLSSKKVKTIEKRGRFVKRLQIYFIKRRARVEIND